MLQGNWFKLTLPFAVAVFLPMPEVEVKVSFPQAKAKSVTKPEFVTPSRSSNTEEQDFAEKCILLINEQRSKIGLPPVKFHETLNKSARWMAEDMVKNNYFDHIDSLGRGVSERMKAFGYKYQLAGQNIAAGQVSAEEAVEDWMNSSGHRAIILKPDFIEIGIAYLKAPQNKYRHFWVCDFGVRQS